jgi:hypothetical protein
VVSAGAAYEVAHLSLTAWAYVLICGGIPAAIFATVVTRAVMRQFDRYFVVRKDEK